MTAAHAGIRLRTTQRYMHLSPSAIDSAIRLLDQGSGSKNLGDIVETGSIEMTNFLSVEQVRWWRRRESNPINANF